jgi:hypothetical protein
VITGSPAFAGDDNNWIRVSGKQSISGREPFAWDA